MKNFFKIIIGISIIAAICYGLNLLRKNEEKISEPEIIRPVRTFVIQNNSNNMLRHYFGTVQGGKRADLSFRVSGTLNKILVEKGASVKKGQLLATLDPRDFNTRVQQAQSSLAQAQAQFKDAEANFKRYENLYKQKVVPKATYDTYKTQLDVTHSAVNTASTQVKSARDALKDTELRAPFDGVIADRKIENFQDITAKQTIFSLQDISNLEIVFNIPDTDVLLAPLPNISKIDELFTNDGKFFKINAHFDAIPDKVFPLKLKEVATQANSTTNTYPVTATMKHQKDLRLLPGMAVTVEVDFSDENKKSETNNTFLVPSTAILNESNNNYVWIFDNGTAKKIPVKIGTMQNNGNIEIQNSNLKNNDLIITAGVYFLREGQKVRLMED